MKRRKTLMRAVGRTHRAWNDYIKRITLTEGIPDSYKTVLMFLLRHPGAGQSDIADFALITSSAVNQTVKIMAAEGYLTKEADPGDKRSSRLYLTQKGSEIAERVFERLGEADAAITDKLGKEKEMQLIAILDEIADYIREELT